MDFDDTPAEAAFRAEARAWLEAHARPLDGALLGVEVGDEAAARHIERCQRWQATLHEHGWAGLTWPVEHGGRGLPPNLAAIFAEEQSRFDAPVGAFAVSIGMVGPTLIAHGTEEQRRRFLGPMLRGTEIWCQLFSEPGAGSDLASLRTKAVRDGDGWVVTGQKVWTSFAQHAQFGILLARTDPGVPKHQGITYFLLDMRSPGVEVRPLRQIDGSAHFNEVFLDGVRVPASAVVGEVGDGWRVARTTLANERALIGGGHRLGWGEVLAAVQAAGGAGDPAVRQGLARAFTRLEVLRFLRYRVRTAASQGRPPGPEASVMKLALSRHVTETSDLVLAAQGAAGMLADGSAPDDGFWERYFLGQWRVKIGGGTDQVQRNVIGEQVLGLPREPSVDRDVAFRDLPA